MVIEPKLWFEVVKMGAFTNRYEGFGGKNVATLAPQFWRGFDTFQFECIELLNPEFQDMTLLL